MPILRFRVFLAAICSAVLFAGCASDGGRDTSAFVYTPPPGTMIKLNRELTGRMGSRIFLQWGYQMRFSEVAKLEPYCQFYVYRPGADLHKPLTIEPDTFIVQRVYRVREFVAVGGTEVAEGKGRPFRGPSERTMSTVLELLSDKQPLVTRLVCSRWADLYPMNHVSIDEIVASLGDVAELILPAGH